MAAALSVNVCLLGHRPSASCRRRRGTGNCAGKSPLPIFGNRVKPQNKKYFAFQKWQIRGTLCPSRPTQRASAVVTDVGRVAMDADVTKTNVADSVRQRRVVLTPRCWRWRWQQYMAHRGDRVISRKAIAQGRPGVLRWTCMLVCTLFCANRTRDRGCSAHPVFPAPSGWRAGGFLAKLGRDASRECDHVFSCRHPRRRVTQYSRGSSD